MKLKLLGEIIKRNKKTEDSRTIASLGISEINDFADCFNLRKVFSKTILYSTFRAIKCQPLFINYQ